MESEKSPLLDNIIDLSAKIQALLENEFIKLISSKNIQEWINYLKAINESIAKYSDTRNTSLPIVDSASSLESDLLSFLDYLLKEQKKKEGMSPFRQQSIVRECQNKMSIIEREIHSFNLDLKQIQQDSKLMPTAMPSTGEFKNDEMELQRYGKARDMWLKYFYQEEQVPWKEFCGGMAAFAKADNGLELTQNELDIIVNSIDEDGDHMIRYDEWKIFWLTTWTYPEFRENLFKAGIKASGSSKFPTQPFELIVKRINKDEDASYSYSLDHSFFISEEKVEFKDFESKTQVVKVDWKRESLVVGRKIKGKPIPHIYFSSKMTSVADKQFQINLKRGESRNGFYLNNMSAGSNPTCLQLEHLSTIVENGMIFQIRDTLIQVSGCQPRAELGALVEDSEEYHFLNFMAKVADPEGTDPTRKVAAGSTGEGKLYKGPSFLSLKCLQEGSAEPQTWKALKKKETIVTVGSSPDMKMQLKGLDEFHFQFRYDTSLSFWMVEVPSECKITEENGVYIYLVHSSEFLGGNSSKPRAGKINVLMKPKMKFFFDGNVLEVVNKN